MDETKSEITIEDFPNWHPETWGGPRPGSGRPRLGGEDDPTVTVTVMMPRSLKEEAIRQGDGNMSLGVRRAVATLALFHAGKPTYVDTEQWYEAIDMRLRSLPQPPEK